MNLSLESFSGNREERFGAGLGNKMISDRYIATPAPLQIRACLNSIANTFNKNIPDQGQLLPQANQSLLKER